MMYQLNPTIPVIITSKDNVKAQAIGWVDYSTEHNLCWICALDNGEVWMVQNPEIRLQSNWTMGRRKRPDVPGATTTPLPLRNN